MITENESVGLNSCKQPTYQNKNQNEFVAYSHVQVMQITITCNTVNLTFVNEIDMP